MYFITLASHIRELKIMLEERVTRPSVRIALMASFAALYIVLSFLSPFIPAIGLPEIKIHIEASFASIFGIILGPWLGASAAFLGSLGTLLLRGASPFDLPFVINPAFNAFIVGLILRKKWKMAFTIFALTIFVFFLTPICIPLTEHWFVGVLSTFDKIIALLLIIPTIIILNQQKSESGLTSSSLSLLMMFLFAFIGNQADAALGNDVFALPIVYEGIFGISLEITRTLFTISPFIYPIIRIIQAIIAAAIGFPLMKALKRLKI